MKPADSEPGRTWFWMGIIAVAGITLSASWALYLEQKSFLTLQHTYDLIINTDALLSNLTDAETGAFGYLLTGEVSYLRLYEASRESLGAPIERLRQLVRDDPVQRARVEALPPLIQQGLDEMTANLRARDSTANSPTSPALRDHGEELAAARRIIHDMQNGEQLALSAFSRSRQARLRNGVAVLVGSAFLASSCMLLGRALLNRNISRRQRAEEELRLSEKRFEILCEQAPLGIYETDALGQCVYTNPGWSKITGLSSNQSLRCGWEKAIHPDDHATVLEWQQSPTLQRGAWEYRLVTARGEVRWIRSLGGPIYSTHGELTGYVGTLEDVTERKQAEQALRENGQELRALAGRLINAEEEERKRISRELHDDFGQKLALLAFDAGSLLLTAPLPDQLSSQLRDLQKRVVLLAQDVRKISHRLHPSILEDLGLTAALQELCEELSTRDGMEVKFEHRMVPRALPVDVASCLYRVAQEALHNVLKHAHTGQVQVKLTGGPDGIRLTVRDTGAGFDMESGAFQQGLGIVSMKERVRLVQGQFYIHSEPGKGAEVRIFVPVARKTA
jgi:PAS domain S-box-containing protein